MKFYRLPSGSLLVPENISIEGVEIDGHVWVEIAPDDPRYADWARFFGTRWEGVLSEEATRAYLIEHAVEQSKTA
jgi:hypothetical protein